MDMIAIIFDIAMFLSRGWPLLASGLNELVAATFQIGELGGVAVSSMALSYTARDSWSASWRTRAVSGPAPGKGLELKITRSFEDILDEAGAQNDQVKAVQP
jgi:hypothetical protein